MGAVVVGSLGVGVTFGAPAGAAPVTVTVQNNHDSGPGSLRAALLAATGTTVVNVPAGLGTITLGSPIVFPSGSGDASFVTIHGNGITINANGKPSALVGNGRALTFDHFVITGVGGSASSDSGGIVAEGGSLSVSSCNLHGNAVHASGRDAGALLSEGGSLTVSSCTLTGNSVRTDGQRGDAGVVISEGGSLTASGCTVTANHVVGTADAATVLSEGGELVVSTCKITANTVSAGGDVGGGADSEGGDTTFRNVTDTCNSGTSDGGDAAGGLLQEGGVPTISGSTIVGNTAKSSGDAAVEQQINSQGPAPVITSSTVSDDRSICQAHAATTTTTTTTTTTVPVTAASTPATTVAAQAELPRTGGHSSMLGLVGLALVSLGAACTYGASTTRRRRTHR